MAIFEAPSLLACCLLKPGKPAPFTPSHRPKLQRSAAWGPNGHPAAGSWDAHLVICVMSVRPIPVKLAELLEPCDIHRA
jgi:hypothetical protein